MKMERYWTSPETYTDPEEFDTRFAPENVSFWVPELIRIGRIESNLRVLDVGCGTGGFSISIGATTGAWVVGFDLSHSLLNYATKKPDGQSVAWVEGSAETLPFADNSFDRVVMSLVFHQIRQRDRAICEAFRVLRLGGLALIRTVAPEAARERIPFRFFPQVAEVEAARMPALPDITRMFSAAGFGDIRTEIVERNREVDLLEVISSLRRRSRPSYKMLTEDVLQEGIAQMRKEWERWRSCLADPRPTAFIVSKKKETTEAQRHGGE
jgi:SAM-dependent methyltransferase